MKIGDEEYLNYPVPVKFWHCEDDKTVSIECTERFVAAIRRAGGIAYLRKFSVGGHEPQLFGEDVGYPTGNAKWRGETLEIKPAVEESFLWFKRFD